jgi:hypothetical protein
MLSGPILCHSSTYTTVKCRATRTQKRPEKPRYFEVTEVKAEAPPLTFGYTRNHLEKGVEALEEKVKKAS